MNIPTTIKSFSAIAVAALGLALPSGQAQADSYHHIDELAIRLQRQARSALNEFRTHYRHTAQYPHLYSDAYQVYRLAAHIHRLAHHHGSLHHISDDVNKLDRLFHHLEDVVAQIEFIPHGHIHGDTHHVHGLLHAMEDTLHHLQADLAELLHPPHGHGHGHGHEPVGITPGLGQGPGVINRPRGGFTFSNGRFGFRIGF